MENRNESWHKVNPEIQIIDADNEQPSNISSIKSMMLTLDFSSTKHSIPYFAHDFAVCVCIATLQLNAKLV